MKNNSSPWAAVVIIFIVIAVLASSATIFGTVLAVGAVLIPLVLVLAGLVFIATHLRPPAWVYVVYGLAWLLIPGITLGVSIVAGVFAGVAFFAERAGK